MAQIFGLSGFWLSKKRDVLVLDVVYNFKLQRIYTVISCNTYTTTHILLSTLEYTISKCTVKNHIVQSKYINAFLVCLAFCNGWNIIWIVPISKLCALLFDPFIENIRHPKPENRKGHYFPRKKKFECMHSTCVLLSNTHRPASLVISPGCPCNEQPTTGPTSHP